MRALLSTVCALTFLARLTPGQEPVKIETPEAMKHRIGSPSVIHSESHSPNSPHEVVHLEVIVDAAGNVDSVKAISGPAEFFSQAENLEAKRKFKPFSRDGTPVRASFSDWVSIVPPEQWAATNTPFPEIKDYSSLKMRLERTECFGACPAYSIEVKGDGSVDFIGKSNVLMIGRHHGQIPQQAVNELLAAFRQSNYFSLRDSYVTRVTDNPTYRTSIEFDGQRKSVRDYVGLEAGMPDAARDLEEAIDRIADTEKWIKGNGATASALVAEKYDFSADSDENRVLFANVVSDGRPDLIQLFVSNQAPALSMTKDGQSALVSAAGKGDLALVKRLLADQSNPPSTVLSCALGAAARGGNLELTQFLLEKGGLADGPLCGKYEKTTVLMDAVMSGKADIVKEILDRHPEINVATETNGFTALSYLFFRSSDRGETEKIFSSLLASGANVNSRDRQGQTPVFYACLNQHPEAVRLLAAAGADLNVKDRNGQTVLMSCFGNAGLKAVIDAGADLTIRNPKGLTAAESARQMGALDEAELLETAMKQKKAQ